MKTSKPLALTFVVLSLLGSGAFAAITSTDEIFTRITTGRIVTEGGDSAPVTGREFLAAAGFRPTENVFSGTG